MPQHIIAFRLKWDSTYEARYQSVVAAIEEITQTKWDQGTSLVILFHPAAAEELHSRIASNSSITADDMLLVLDVDVLRWAGTGIDREGLLQFVLSCRDQAVPAGLFALGASAVDTLSRR
jgi:hypothetical protein